MAYIAPKTWAYKETLSSSDLNTYVRDNEISHESRLPFNNDLSLADISAPFTEYGMARQAIMNGNFDIWQRGTSVALPDVTDIFQADRWCDYNNKDGGTLPTLTRSRQLQTSGDIANSFYFTRLATNGAGASLGVNSASLLRTRIENGTSKLCGLNKKVTVSFWARTSIAGTKRLGVSLQQNYGTGGSPTAEEKIITQTPIILTSSWVKYTVTFITNTLVGKTFGTNGDDYLHVNFLSAWGTTFGNTYVYPSVTAETFVGAGNIDIAQVQLCSGDVALPFKPKSYEEELRACQRYYREVYPRCSGNGATNSFRIICPGIMRSTPVVSSVGNINVIEAGGGVTTAGAQTYSSLATQGEDNVYSGTTSGATSNYAPRIFDGKVAMISEP